MPEKSRQIFIACESEPHYHRLNQIREFLGKSSVYFFLVYSEKYTEKKYTKI